MHQSIICKEGKVRQGKLGVEVHRRKTKIEMRQWPNLSVFLFMAILS
jgi:hypothetical protein